MINLTAKNSLIIVFVLLFIALFLYFPKIYLRSNIYYISKDINKLYVLNMRYSGEMFYEKVVIIVEEENSYSPTMFLYKNSLEKIAIKYKLSLDWLCGKID